MPVRHPYPALLRVNLVSAGASAAAGAGLGGWAVVGGVSGLGRGGGLPTGSVVAEAVPAMWPELRARVRGLDSSCSC